MPPVATVALTAPEAASRTGKPEPEARQPNPSPLTAFARIAFAPSPPRFMLKSGCRAVNQLTTIAPHPPQRVRFRALDASGGHIRETTPSCRTSP